MLLFKAAILAGKAALALLPYAVPAVTVTVGAHGFYKFGKFIKESAELAAGKAGEQKPRDAVRRVKQGKVKKTKMKLRASLRLSPRQPWWIFSYMSKYENIPKYGRRGVVTSCEGISLAPLHDRISWAELHREWDTREDKARGKILLLYSPDTKLFKELQEAFKSFLDLACHCDIYDLFDDALSDTIALDPSEWLQEFVNDEDVKILVISSAGK